MPLRTFKATDVFNGDVQLVGERRERTGTHIVFAHGWISSRRMWREVLDGLPDEVAASAFDFRGCGESDRPLAGHDLDGYVSDLRAWIECIPAPVVVVGHSMGARVAQYLATRAPDNFAGMLLVAPGVAAGTIVVPRHRELTARAYGSRRRIKAFQRGAMFRDLAEATLERIVEDALFAQREHWFGWYDDGRTGDFSDRLSSVRMPISVLAGARDPLIPAGRIQRELIDRYTDTALTVVEDAGHNLPVEVPDAIIAEISAFLARMSSP